MTARPVAVAADVQAGAAQPWKAPAELVTSTLSRVFVKLGVQRRGQVAALILYPGACGPGRKQTLPDLPRRLETGGSHITAFSCTKRSVRHGFRTQGGI